MTTEGGMFSELPRGWESDSVLRKHAKWTTAHVTATFEGSSNLVDCCATTLDQHGTLVTTLPLEITMIVEANGFSEAVRTRENMWCNKGHKRAHMYVTGAVRLARLSEQRFQEHTR